MIKRVYVKKKDGFNIEAKELLADVKENLNIKTLKNIIVLNRYDCSNISEETFKKALNTVFSEPQVDEYFIENYEFNKEDYVFGVEFLPGQFDQRANALEECLQILEGGNRPIARSAKIYILQGDIDNKDVDK